MAVPNYIAFLGRAITCQANGRASMVSERDKELCRTLLSTLHAASFTVTMTRDLGCARQLFCSDDHECQVIAWDG